MAKYPTFSEDPVPEKAIRLSEAYKRVLKALSANQALIDGALEDYAYDWKEDLEKIEPRFRAEAAANAFFRCHLIWGKSIHGEVLHANVRDPNTGLVLQLSPMGWQPEPRPPVLIGPHKRSDYEPIITGLDSDFVIDPYDECFAGPFGTVIDGACRPVFFWRDDFERWFEKTFGVDRPIRRGRKLGTGSFDHVDEPFMKEMDVLIETGKAVSPRMPLAKSRNGPTAGAHSSQSARAWQSGIGSGIGRIKACCGGVGLRD